MTAPLRVFLVDDHAVVRRGLVAYLDGEDDIDVVGEAANGRTALDRIAVLVNAGSAPDVVLMDLLMPELSGVEATREIVRRWPQIKVVAVTSFLAEDKVRDALDAGAAGYLLKDAEADDVAAAVRAVVRGGMAIPPTVARTLVDAVRRPAPDSALTPRERQVITLVAEGHTNQQIANRLAVSERTARTHVSNILAKLNLTSRTQAAMWAARNGLTSRDHQE
ncbi:response regulator transcription factor [Streptomyces bungoensis]|uniref:response regulator transcription factor n=1 Tax=Streptomyces bungoensis TaxID=285568 RepID=UPI0033EB33E5